MDQTAVETLRSLKPGDAPRRFPGVDLRGADLSGIQLSLVSLAGARLDGANLSQASFELVNLSGASLEGTRLDRSRLGNVRAEGVSLAGCSADRSHWEQVTLGGANLSGAQLRRSFLIGCDLRKARLDGANLTLTWLTDSDCHGASFRAALLDRCHADRTSMREADFSGARKFYATREVVVELLSREVGGDIERARFVGAISLMPRWCYAEFHKYLQAHPEYFQLAVEILAKHEGALAAEALREGWSADREVPSDESPLPSRRPPDSD